MSSRPPGEGSEATIAQTFHYPAPPAADVGDAAAPQWAAAVARSFSEGAPEHLEQARMQAFAEGVASARRENELQAAKLREQIARAVGDFAEERQLYFDKVEEQVVLLSLAIVRKILHRESQMDPLLLAGVVHVALERLNSGSAVRLRAHPRELEKWSRCFAGSVNAMPKIEFVPDAGLDVDHCILETELGSTDIGLETQLKEIEKGFLDLLAQRPERK